MLAAAAVPAHTRLDVRNIAGYIGSCMKSWLSDNDGAALSRNASSSRLKRHISV